MRKYGPLWSWLLLLAVAIVLASCKPDAKVEAPEIRPVRTVTAAKGEVGETVVLTGHVQAENEPAFAFRIGGRMIERPVNVGARVEAGQVLAKLDPENELNELRSAEAALAAAQGQLTYARGDFERQRQLLANGHTPRARFDQSQNALQNAQSQVDNAEAQLQIARDRVSWTTLTADASGTVTARGAEPGEVVQAGQMIVRLAREGGRDAVFDVPAQLLRSAPNDAQITVRLTDDPSVTAIGRVREVAPQADPVTRTFEVKVGLSDPPEAMRLGATATGSVTLESEPVISIPASALTEFNRQPAVWIVDPRGLTVSLRNVELLRHDPGTVVIAQGLDTGDIVVTAGIQALHPGQKVRLLGSSS
ncbi:MAG TPA: efflux RND transporter periplasmic adaptor subunit [Stellaceae bacterium]|nr:efflux RND transporter periplasmic adaptor subunit [Stellaceae bacterium]